MRFVSVTALSCNSQGIQGRQGSPREAFHLNVDLIGAIKGRDVWLKGGKILTVAGNYYIDIKLVEGVNIEEI